MPVKLVKRLVTTIIVCVNLINPQRMRRGVTVVICLCVCVSLTDFGDSVIIRLKTSTNAKQTILYWA